MPQLLRAPNIYSPGCYCLQDSYSICILWSSCFSNHQVVANMCYQSCNVVPHLKVGLAGYQCSWFKLRRLRILIFVCRGSWVIVFCRALAVFCICCFLRCKPPLLHLRRFAAEALHFLDWLYCARSHTPLLLSPLRNCGARIWLRVHLLCFQKEVLVLLLTPSVFF